MEKEINMFAMDKGGWAPWVELMDISLKIRVNPECFTKKQWGRHFRKGKMRIHDNDNLL